MLENRNIWMMGFKDHWTPVAVVLSVFVAASDDELCQ